MYRKKELKNYLLLKGLRQSISEDCQHLSEATNREASFLLKKIRGTILNLQESAQILKEASNLK